MVVGFNIGSISVKIAEIDDHGMLVYQKIVAHQGQPESIVNQFVNNQSSTFYGVSGHLGHISESEAIERALEVQTSSYDVVISLGGEAFAVYLLKDNKISNVLSHNRCAAGSGEFLVQQISRLNLTLDEAIELAKSGKSIKLASRCSVHCKSDVTHKLNRKEATLEDILYSIHESMAGKIISLLEKSNHPYNSILVIGGLSQNEVMIQTIEEHVHQASVTVLPESPVFEALGTALLTMDQPIYSEPRIRLNPMFLTLPMLSNVDNLVTILKPSKVDTFDRSIERPLIIGIDGGSTTTKVAIVDVFSQEVVASYYARTNGDPINATKECIREVMSQVGNVKVELIATTGSAREIIGAFVGTSAVYNEISAHAKGALSFDNEVDTIFEIGGQDAKYIYIENNAPVDYAMNAACSAGTGSFLEESAQSDLGVSVYDISDVALRSPSPVRFKAECAAFINSDIRAALQEGYTKQDIIGGLVNSIVNNYLTKVKGPRKVGKKVFLQGGVAKNNSIAYAFAQATGKQIIVPPNPELMGAYGVALMALEKSELGYLKVQSKYLDEMIMNKMEVLGNFICRSCENYCTINRYRVGNRKFPFGGQCSKYENQWKNTIKVEEVPDYVEMRNKLIFSVVDDTEFTKGQPTIGIPRALTTHFLLPLYYSFLKQLGFNVVVSGIDDDGELTVNAPFCFPTQIAHGAVLDLINHKNPDGSSVDYIFFPQIQKMPFNSSEKHSYLCPITQASPFILQKAFSSEIFLSPSLNFQQGYRKDNGLIDMFAEKFNFAPADLQRAYVEAVTTQLLVEKKMRELGKSALKDAISHDRPAIIIVGRSYNAFPKETSQSMGRKLASKGIVAIPHDCLGTQTSTLTSWYFANLILDAVDLTKKHENLYLLYISNFGCNIDSFTQEYLRGEMSRKPFLKLDIDSHTADAGTQTRIEAFLEIIEGYRKSHQSKEQDDFIPCSVIKYDDKYLIRTSSNEKVELNNPRVQVHFPVFSKYHSDTLPMVFRWLGFNSPKPLELSIDQLNLGLQYTAGTECLPLPIYFGQLLNLYENKQTDEIIAFYMFEGGAPCVVASYIDLLNKFIQDNKMENVFIFSPYIQNNYYGISKLALYSSFPLGISIADVMVEIHNVLEVVGVEGSTQLLLKYWHEFLDAATSKDKFNQQIPKLVEKITNIETKADPKNHPKVLVTGDFFVRFDPFFFKGLIDKYAKKGIILKPVDLNEMIMYPSYDDLMDSSEEINSPPNSRTAWLKAAASCRNDTGKKYLGNWLSIKILQRYEKNMRNKFLKTGLIIGEQNKIKDVVDFASPHIDRTIYGESVLTIGKAAEAMTRGYQGILILGPFSCLPFRISEAILRPLCIDHEFPFLSYETDGRSIPPAFLRLVDVHVQQILRKWEIENASADASQIIVTNEI